MQRIAYIFAFLAALLGASSIASAQPTPGNFPYVYIDNGEDKDPDVYRTNVVPLWPDKICFGWTMAIEGRDRKVDLTEVLTLSSPSTSWSHGPETVVENGDKATTKIKIDVVDNRIARSWCVAEGDPPGQYRYNIFIDGQHRAEFIYCAVKVPDDGSVDIDELKCPYKFDSVEMIRQTHELPKMRVASRGAAPDR
ncbi:MAG: hypothetical protein ABI439_06850 [Rhodospirillales bacterium]